MNTQDQPVTASLVAEAQRLDFLPTYFGPRLMMRGEALVYAWLRRLCERYNGAYWHYYTLSDGGFYLAPDLAERLEVEVDGNGFRGELSADAAGIVATLFALGHLAAEIAGTEQFFAHLIELQALVCTGGDHGIVGDAGPRLLRGVPGTDVAHVLRAQHAGERRHHRGHATGAFAGLELVQLLGDVALRHAGNARRVLLHGVAVQSVAGGTGTGLGLASLGIAPGRGLVVQRRNLHRRGVGHGDSGALGVGDRGQREAGNTGKPDEGATMADKTHAELHT